MVGEGMLVDDGEVDGGGGGMLHGMQSARN